MYLFSTFMLKKLAMTDVMSVSMVRYSEQVETLTKMVILGERFLNLSMMCFMLGISMIVCKRGVSMRLFTLSWSRGTYAKGRHLWQAVKIPLLRKDNLDWNVVHDILLLRGHRGYLEDKLTGIDGEYLILSSQYSLPGCRW